MNPFSYQVSAERYSRNRPYFHPFAMNKIKNTLGLSDLLSHALDVACGTGHSSKALKELAHSVVGADLSPQMMSQAPIDPAITYVQAAAEHLPFETNLFDLLTVGLAFHWFNHAQFLTEAHRVLASQGWLVIYNNGFANEMKGNPAYGEWMHDHYQPRFPRVSNSHWKTLTDDYTQPFGLKFVKHETYTNEMSFSVDEMALYMMTHSNIIVPIESGREREEDVFAWLTESMAPFFGESPATFVFGGTIEYLQKQD